MINVLSTRTLKEYLINYGRQLDLSIDCVDFIETVSVVPVSSYSLPEDVDSLIFTSSNAVKYFFENYPAKEIATGKTIFSLAANTTDELLKYGVKPDYTAETASSLSWVLVDKKVRSPLHVCGDKRLSTIEEKLLQNGIQYHQLIVYQTILLTDKKIEKDYDAIMFYSPSGVKAFFTNNELREGQIFCCIGDTTASAMREINADLTILIPDNISLESMIDKISEYYKTNVL